MSERDDLSAGLQIPDLELEPAVSKRPESVTARGSHSARLGSSPSGFADDDAFELVPTGAKLELSGDVIQPGPESQRATAAWPNGRTDSAEQLRVDPLEVTLVADYGVAPSSVALTPLYAYRVYARRRHLQRAVAEHHAALQRDEAERDEALAQLASELRPTLEANETFKRMLEPVRELERLAGDRNAALSQADAGYREQLAGFERELLGIGESLVEARKLLARCSDAAESTDADLRRAEGRNRRIQIEIRGVMDLARQALGPAGGDLPAPQAAQLANLQTRLHGLQPELDRTRAAHVGSSTELERARSELKRLEDKAHRVEREKAAAGGSLERKLSARVAGVSEAETGRRAALADLARAALASRGSFPMPEASLTVLLAHDARVGAQALRLETHLRALDSQDHERVRQGVILALFALGLVVLAIALKAVL